MVLHLNLSSFVYFADPPALNLLGSPPLPPATRTDIDLGPGGVAFVVDNVLAPDECDALVAASEAMGYSRFAPAIRTPPGMRLNSAVSEHAS